MNKDTEFFWAGVRERRLLIQQCSACRRLRHPPGPACAHCHSLDWGVAEASGRGELYSYTVLHHPKAPGFDDPAVAIVVQLDEGVRLVSNLADAEPGALLIGEPLEVFFLDQDEGWTVPQFRRHQPGDNGARVYHIDPPEG
jgi:uncharacterized protein